jgi:hypothetical protein
MTNQNRPPVPVSGLAAVLAIVQAVVAVVPRWLVVAAGVVFVSWLGFELSQKAQQATLQTETMRAQKVQEETKAHAMSSSPRF